MELIRLMLSVLWENTWPVLVAAPVWFAFPMLVTPRNKARRHDSPCCHHCQKEL
jgi:hypothetical protein